MNVFQPTDADHCRECWLWLNRPEYRESLAKVIDRTHGVTQTAPPPCISLGPTAPNQSGVPCGQRVRACDEFGECVVQEPCAEAKAEGKVQHWCIGTDGKRCPEYVAKDT